MTRDLNRNANFESFEPRLVMSAQALSDFVADFPTSTQQVDVEQFIETLSTEGGDENPLADLEAVREQYNLSGKGQTVAVIDSGIFYNHEAFGGFGEGQRVVGGYDFAENDADPHEDGPVGIHGTHVSGIIAGSSDEYSGVAPGADLVSLRVFDDNGAGDIGRVEQALQWVHDNRNAFEHPITTVNLSIGTNFNSDSIPALAQLEEEFAQLEEDGIFISVAAGNFFQSFNTTGVSYPAASPFVVPVASHGADGNLSDFSQRNDNVLVAPGEGILSAVPDHIFRDGTTDGYLRSTGTSQAAPYTAGASALLREAFQRSGVEDIDQDLLYEHFRDTADIIHDQATGGFFHRINVERAIAEALADDHGDTFSTSTNVGVVSGGELIRGSIGSTVDVDHFRFTAEQTGRFTLNVGSSNELTPEILAGSNATLNGNQVSFDVVAGNEYQFSVGSHSGTGSYTIELDFAEAPPSPVSLDGAGVLTVNGTSGDDLVSIRHGANVEVNINGQQFQFNANQINDIVVAGRGGHDSISATFENDIESAVLSRSRASVAGDSFEFSARGFNHIGLHAEAGSSQLIVRDSDGNDVVDASFESTRIFGSGYEHTATGFTNATFHSSGGFDRVVLNGTDDAERLIATDGRVALRNDGGRLTANGFEAITVHARSGRDVAQITDSAGNDHFELTRVQVNATYGNQTLLGTGFDRIFVDASSGFDTIRLNGSDLDDTLIHRNERTRFESNFHFHSVAGFDRINVVAYGGNDLARYFDSSGNDVFSADGFHASLNNNLQIVNSFGFETTNAISVNGGFDTAEITGTDFADHLVSNESKTTFNTAFGAENSVRGFDQTSVDTLGGRDTTTLTGSQQRDVLRSLDNQLELESTTRMLKIINAEAHQFNGGAGVDEVSIEDFGNNDLLEALGDQAMAYIGSRQIELTGIEFLDARVRQGESSDYEIEAVDFLYLLDGNWQEAGDDQ